MKQITIISIIIIITAKHYLCCRGGVVKFRVTDLPLLLPSGGPPGATAWGFHSDLREN